jgi:hypothetical protein
MKTLSILLSFAALAVTLFVSPVLAEDEPYKEYKPRTSKAVFFRIAFNDAVIAITVPGADGRDFFEIPISDVEATETRVRLGSGIAFTEVGLEVDGVTLAYDQIVDLRLSADDDQNTITAFRLKDPDDAGRIRRGNRIDPFGNIVIGETEFVRGFVFTVTGNIDAFGEVSKDIVSLFGDVFIGPEAVARGDIASITGQVEVARDASVYGEILTGTEAHRGRSRRFYGAMEETDLDPWLVYNRVDGLILGNRFSYYDIDSVLPFVTVWGGYAIQSERLRLGLEIEQVVWRPISLSVGGSVFKDLLSEDDWIIKRDENTAFALLFTEDYRDYYEALGGRGWIRAVPVGDVKVQAGYEYIETKWLRAYQQMWSLFGGDKMFSRNFARVPEAYRRAGIAEIDSTINASFNVQIDWDTRDPAFPFEESAWAFAGWLEISDGGLGSDFDYNRYRLNLRRYQQINRYTTLILRGVFGNSDGYLPMYKRFYLGGLGTLRGYKHKELMGSRFWLLNGEYRFRFPKTDLALSLMYDAAQIANDTKIDGDIDLDQSLGVGLYLGDDVRLSLARRLDGAEDKDLQFYARFEYTF